MKKSNDDTLKNLTNNLEKILHNPTSFSSYMTQIYGMDYDISKNENPSENVWTDISLEELKEIEKENRSFEPFGSYHDAVNELQRLGLLSPSDIIKDPHIVHTIWHKAFRKIDIKFCEECFVPSSYIGTRESFIIDVTNLLTDYCLQMNAFLKEPVNIFVDKYIELFSGNEKMAIIMYHNNEILPRCIDCPSMANSQNFTNLICKNLGALFGIVVRRSISWA